MIAYRICERRGEKLLTLFHALNGSRVLPIGIWLKATIKPVYDGSHKTAKEYLSGFHVLADLNECRAFTSKFRANRDLVIVKCDIKGNRTKDHSPSNIILADEMKLIEVVEKVKIKNHD
jgi:hypothetical protein